MNVKKFYLLKFVAISCVSLAVMACHHLAKEMPPPNAQAPGLSVYSGQPNPLFRVVIESPAAQQILTGAQAQVPKVAESSAPNASVSVLKSAKDTHADALSFTWQDTWRAALQFEAMSPLDLSEYSAAGVIEFDLNVLELAKGGLAFNANCVGSACARKISYLLEGRQLAGKGWQHLALPLQCFVHAGADMTAVKFPFSLEVGGEGKLAIANLRLAKTGVANVACPDYKTLSVTPDILNEWWSTSWWLPRHLQKLDEVKAKQNAQLIFIGDSITQGWEKEGFNVWNRYYAKYNAVALGFGGDRTENVLWRLQHGEVDGLHPKVAVLMFGTNNTGHRHEDPSATAAGIKRNLVELQQRLPNTKILLLAIFPRDATPAGELRQLNNRVNDMIASFADNKTVFFADINHAFLDANGVLSTAIMPDLLHPNEQGYERWARAMAPRLNSLLAD